MSTRKLSPTSQLVLLMTEGQTYTSRPARRYLDSISLDAGEELLSECSKIWPHYGEVIKNRKHCILDLARRSIAENRTIQVVILGAGADPLSIELASYSENARMFELDYEGMDAKASRIRSACPELAGSISCIEADMLEPDIPARLARHGWDADRPSLVVAEGISYYLPAAALWGLMGRFRTPDRANAAVLEYLLPAHMIAAHRAHIPDRAFGVIQDRFDLKSLTRYDIQGITRRVAGLGGSVCDRHDMTRMERSRTGRNEHFASADSGWIEVCRILI